MMAHCLNYCFFNFQNVIGYHKKELSVIGEGCELGDKVTLKQCSIGKGCHIGAKSKLNNCIIMDHTIIGERYESFKCLRNVSANALT